MGAKRAKRVNAHRERAKRYVPADSAQQLVGGFLLAGPFVVTEEVWRLAANMSHGQTLAAIVLVVTIGYGALYKTNKDRDPTDPEREAQFGGVPIRFLSLVAISYLSVTTLVLLFAAPETFEVSLVVTGKAICIGAIFSVIGAATADSLF